MRCDTRRPALLPFTGLAQHRMVLGRGVNWNPGRKTYCARSYLISCLLLIKEKKIDCRSAIYPAIGGTFSLLPRERRKREWPPRNAQILNHQETAGERVDGVGDAGLIGDDLLGTQGDADGVFRRQSQGLVAGVGVQGLGSAQHSR